jgi:hypothetical protein
MEANGVLCDVWTESLCITTLKDPSTFMLLQVTKYLNNSTEQKALSHFHGNIGYTIVPQLHVTYTLPILLNII